jgi:hypothetical protein
MKGRISPALTRYDSVRASGSQQASGMHARFMFLNTFVHALIKELTFNCGWGERSRRPLAHVDTWALGADDPLRPQQGCSAPRPDAATGRARCPGQQAASRERGVGGSQID